MTITPSRLPTTLQIPLTAAPASAGPTAQVESAQVPARNRVTSDYSDLSKLIREHNLLARRVGFYVKKFAIVTLLVAVTAVAFFYLRASWFSLIPAFAFGVFNAQYGFIAHEASHRQIFTSKKANDWVAIIVADLFVGLSYGWWGVKHTRHHVNPNTVGKDPDIAIAVISLSTESLESKQGLERFFAKRQGWLLPVFLLFTGFDLLYESFGTLFDKKESIPYRKLEIAMMSFRVIAPTTAIFLLMPNPLMAAAFCMVQMMTFGIFMGGSFAPNHKGMPLIAKDSKVDFLRRQVLTSRNIKGSWLIDNLMGGLNYQIEHHLFPSMPRPALKKASELTKQYCADRGIDYTEVGLLKSYSIVMSYLSKVGVSGNSNPFDCPMITALRPRD